MNHRPINAVYFRNTLSTPPVISEHKYILYGEPIPLSRCRHGRREWDQQQEQKVLAALHLSHLHNDKPLFRGPLELNIDFFFGISQKTSAHKKFLSHIQAPQISRLIKFIEEIASGVLFADEYTIASISSRKLYDFTPRTEFSIKQIKVQ